MSFLDRLLARKRDRSVSSSSFDLAGIGQPNADRFSLGLNPASSSFGTADAFSLDTPPDVFDEALQQRKVKKERRTETRQTIAALLPNLARILTAQTELTFQGALSDVADVQERARATVEARRTREAEQAFQLMRDNGQADLAREMEAKRETFDATQNRFNRGAAHADAEANRLATATEGALTRQAVASEGALSRSAQAERDKANDAAEWRRLSASLGAQSKMHFDDQLQEALRDASFAVSLGAAAPEELDLAIQRAQSAHDPNDPFLASLIGRGRVAQVQMQSGKTPFEMANEVEKIANAEYNLDSEFGVLPTDPATGEKIRVEQWKAKIPVFANARATIEKELNKPSPDHPSNAVEAFQGDPLAQLRALPPDLRAVHDQKIATLSPSQLAVEAKDNLAKGVTPEGVLEILAPAISGTDPMSMEKRAQVQKTIELEMRKRAIDAAGAAAGQEGKVSNAITGSSLFQEFATPWSFASEESKKRRRTANQARF